MTDSTVAKFVASLASIVLSDCFNPYRDHCPDYDTDDSPAIRRNNLAVALSHAATMPTVDVWVGREPGYRGARRTGLAFTDELQLSRWDLGLGGVARATVGSMQSERTATMVWKMISEIEESPFLWNVFPFHSHEQGNPYSNRPHNKQEAAIGQEFLKEVLLMLKPQRVVAVGADAKRALDQLGCTSAHVRHPSRGGWSQFAVGIRELYGLPTHEDGATTQAVQLDSPKLPIL